MSQADMKMIFSFSLVLLVVNFYTSSLAQTAEYIECINLINRQILIDLELFEKKMIDAKIITNEQSSFFEIYLTFSKGEDVWVERNYQEVSALDSLDLYEFEKCFIAYFDNQPDQKVIIQKIYSDLNSLSSKSIQDVALIITNYLEPEDFNHRPWRDKTILTLYKTAVRDSLYMDLLPPVPKN